MTKELCCFATLDEFLSREFKFCFVCGLNDYREYRHNSHLYRLCDQCIWKENVREFFQESLQ